MGHSTKEGDLGRYNRCKRRSKQQDSSSVKRTASGNILTDEDDRTLSHDHSLNYCEAETISTNIHRSDDETPSSNMSELSHPAAKTVSEDVCRSGTTSPDMDGIHLPTVIEVNTPSPLQIKESDIMADREKENETRSLQLDNQNLRDELTRLKSHANILTIGLFKNDQDVLQFYTALPNWTVFKAIFDLHGIAIATQ